MFLKILSAERIVWFVKEENEIVCGIYRQKRTFKKKAKMACIGRPLSWPTSIFFHLKHGKFLIIHFLHHAVVFIFYCYYLLWTLFLGWALTAEQSAYQYFLHFSYICHATHSKSKSNKWKSSRSCGKNADQSDQIIYYNYEC